MIRRIRENSRTFYGETFPTIANHSLMQTLARSLITSLTLLRLAPRHAQELGGKPREHQDDAQRQDHVDRIWADRGRLPP